MALEVHLPPKGGLRSERRLPATTVSIKQINLQASFFHSSLHLSLWIKRICSCSLKNTRSIFVWIAKVQNLNKGCFQRRHYLSLHYCDSFSHILFKIDVMSSSICSPPHFGSVISTMVPFPYPQKQLLIHSFQALKHRDFNITDLLIQISGSQT